MTEREVRYCTSPDGTRIAYSIEGEGLPFVWVPGWVSHLEIDAQLVAGMGIREFQDGILNIGMDKRGGGLSDRNVQDFSLDARVDDVIAVADAVEAMLSDRPYRPSLGVAGALSELAQHRGTSYDPAVIDACVRLFTEQGFELPG